MNRAACCGEYFGGRSHFQSDPCQKLVMLHGVSCCLSGLGFYRDLVCVPEQYLLYKALSLVLDLMISCRYVSLYQALSLVLSHVGISVSSTVSSVRSHDLM